MAKRPKKKAGTAPNAAKTPRRETKSATATRNVSSATSRTAARTRSNSTPAPAVIPLIAEPLFYPLHGLLESIRVLKTYEDSLCALLHTLQTSGSAGPEERHELTHLIDELPAAAFLQEWHTLRNRLHDADAEPTPPPVTPSPAAAKTRRRPVSRQSR